MNQEDRELLIRIDERTLNLLSSISELKNTLGNKVENDVEYKALVVQVKTMWDLKNRAMGYIAAWSAGISIAAAIAVEYIKNYFGR